MSPSIAASTVSRLKQYDALSPSPGGANLRFASAGNQVCISPAPRWHHAKYGMSVRVESSTTTRRPVRRIRAAGAVSAGNTLPSTLHFAGENAASDRTTLSSTLPPLSTPSAQ